jgi:hypothetical protein
VSESGLDGTSMIGDGGRLKWSGNLGMSGKRPDDAASTMGDGEEQGVLMLRIAGRGRRGERVGV